MPTHPRWQETESQVYTPHRWILLAIGLMFVSICFAAIITVIFFATPNTPFWYVMLGFAVLGPICVIPFAWGVATIVWPTQIRHAADDVLPDVPDEPVITEGIVVHGNLTHDLVEEARRWEFRPAKRLRHSTLFMLYGFGVPFMIFFAGLLSWVFHEEMGIDHWLGAIFLAVFITLFSGGTALLVIGLIIHSGHRQLSTLMIPKKSNPLELDMPVAVEPKGAKDGTNIIEGLKCLAQEGSKRQQLSVPRDWVRAVQLCPWKYEFDAHGSSTYMAVQGLLVLKEPEATSYVRLPIMLTGHYVGAARLMRKLAEVLEVPYLFHADAEGWKVEVKRAKTRPPMQSGGWLG